MSNRFPPEHFVGTIGERRELHLTVEQVKVSKSFYGTSYVYLCRDSQGKQVVYKGRAPFLEEGQSGTVKATVEYHQNYDGSPETLIVRPKLVKAEPPMSPFAQAQYVSVVTDSGRRLPPLEQILVGMLLTDDLPPPSEKTVAAMDKLYREVLSGRYGWREEVRAKNGVWKQQEQEAHAE